MNIEGKVEKIPLISIIPNRFQPRLSFDANSLQELANSIKEHGIIQPLVLRKAGDKYEIIAGERRYKAASLAGLKEVPAIITDIDDNSSAEIAIVENVQRKNLSSIEEAISFKTLLDKGYMTQEQLANKMGISQSSIANKLRLLNLCEEVQQALLNEKISERHARSLLVLPDFEDQKRLLNKIIAERLTVRQLDLEIKRIQGENETKEVEKVEEPKTPAEIVSVAKDIEVEKTSPTISKEEPTPPSEEKSKTISNFFNFLENEEVNMNVEIPKEEQKFESEEITENNEKKQDELSKDIEILDIPSPSEEQPPETLLNQETIKSPEPPMSIPKIDGVDPVNSIDLVDPNYIQKQEVAETVKGELRLKDAISSIRNKIEELEESGFTIETEELDMLDSYKINITINNN